jgi:excisionase family DNA binding protein
MKEKRVPLVDQKTLNVREAAEVLGTSVPNINELIKERKIRCMPLGKSVKIYNWELDEFCKRATEEFERESG